MARSRNIKPGFFLNDELAECDPLARLLFAGLWCIADREGRLEDRPKRIKAEVLPYDDCDIDQLLNQLAEHGFIIRYEIAGNRYIQVTNFSKHQNPHVREAASNIPPPPTHEGASEKHHTSTVQEQEKHKIDPADSLKLIPDSLNLGTEGGSGGNNETEKPQPEIIKSPNNYSEKLKNTTSEEREILSVLKSIELYPFDFEKDLQFIRDLATDYPSLDLLYQVKKWRDYKRDKPLAKKSSPRAQLRNWMNKADEWRNESNEKTGRNTARGNARADPAGKYRQFVRSEVF